MSSKLSFSPGAGVGPVALAAGGNSVTLTSVLMLEAVGEPGTVGVVRGGVGG